MMTVTSLDTLSTGSSGRLKGITGERSFRCRLMELGLLPGTAIRVIRRLDRSGLIELEVRGCRLSVRQSEARLVTVDVS
jgi:Fe2+ transport system protein FeoA